MSEDPGSWAEKLAELQQQYALELPAKLDAIDRDWQSLAGGATGSHLADLIRKVHNLAGTGATFGLPMVSERARALERFLTDEVAQDGHALAHSSRFTELLQALRQAGAPGA